MLHKILEQHPEDSVRVTVLVRDDDKAARLRAKYPQVQTIIGNMKELEKIESASRNADLVVNTSPDITHDDGIRAIVRGLKAQSGKAPFYVHTSGASLIWDEPKGSPDARLWDDLTDVAELSAMEAKYTHAVTDRIVREAAADGINVAIMSPGYVGGLSPSIEHPTFITLPALLNTARAFNSGFQIEGGRNQCAWIDVNDLADMFMILINDALAGGVKTLDGQPLWGTEAYYFGVFENIPFREFMEALAPVFERHGAISSSEIQSVDVVAAARISLAGPGGEYDPLAPPPPPDSWAIHIANGYGINMRLKASRMEKLGWKPEKGSVKKSFGRAVAQYLELEKAKAE